MAAVRETLRLGATQIKLNAGGGVTSRYDPLDSVQFSPGELRAAVSAAQDWHTYVLVHAYTDDSVIRALESGVMSIEHAHLIGEKAMAMISRKGAFLSTQARLFRPTEEEQARMLPHQIEKGRPTAEGLERMMKLARRHKVKMAFGADLFGSPEKFATHSEEFGARLTWFTPVEILRQATSINAELFALSGPRSPYQEGDLGVIRAGAYADLLIVDGNPLEDIRLLENPQVNLRLIMKNGVIHKNTL